MTLLPLRRRAARSICTLAAAALAAAAFPSLTLAQVPADESWWTIRTRHFDVHFTRALEPEARRAASVAERAYGNLASALVPPRGRIDIVVADGADVSNGSATVFPRNHIVIQARPPVDATSLRSYDDWTALVLQHELTHIFHLDRSRGWWRAAQYLFGRNPALFPNLYAPSWLTEGLAVYYESRFVPGGRLAGTYHAAVVRAAAAERDLPALSSLSLATSRFPYGQSAYVYGSFLVAELAARGGPGSVRSFIERTSGDVTPYLLDRDARAAFGETFSQAWRAWRDSVQRAGAGERAGRPARVVPVRAAALGFPRWLGDTAVMFAANDGRETPGAYVLDARAAGATLHRIGRRNSIDANVPPVARGAPLVFAQLDYIDRFRIRSDLYAADSGRTRRLTRGARLASPDVRRDGAIVAVQTLPATTRLVRVSRDGTIVPITGASLDTQWVAPRWSPSGDAIAAIRIAGGHNELVELDTSGVVATVVRSAAPIRSVAWDPDGRNLVYTADEGGVARVHIVAAGVRDGDATGGVLVSEPGGIYDVDVARASGDTLRIAGTTLRGDGYAIALWDGTPSDTAGIRLQRDRSYAPWTVVPDTSAARPYRPWRTLPPAYWSPTFASDQGTGALVGGFTSGEDVIGRHAYLAQGAVNTRNGHVDGSVLYRYGRLAHAVIGLSVDQSWAYGMLFGSTGGLVGTLERRIRTYAARATLVRPRVRTFASLTGGVELEERLYDTDPARLVSRLDPYFSRVHRFPTLLLAGTFSNTQRPLRSISPEDGVTLAAAGRQRWESGAGSAGRSVVAVAAAYKSLDLGGYAHHVVALRLAGGSADSRTPTEYSVGGVSGAAIELVPGVVVGDPARTFPVRGFAPGSEQGVRAFAASAEYRAPLALVARGVRLLPVFLDRASVSFFGDAGRASCPRSAATICGMGRAPLLASVGAEVDFDTAIQYDIPMRLRAGVAHPVAGARYAGARPVSLFVTLGGTF